MKRLFVFLAVMAAAPCWADDLTVDARFDRTGDGIVDAGDWSRMSEADKAAYAYASVQGLGEDPYTELEGQRTRGDRYLEGLRSVYE